MWIERNIRDRLLKTAGSMPAMLLTGARQTGKSSLLRREFPDAAYITFDYLRHMEAAKESPEYFLTQFKAGVILDEIQYVPEIFRELKILIDVNRKIYGKWIMTGSQQFVLMEKVSESLAGRLIVLRLETLSADELRNKNVTGIKNYLWKGGYPEIWVNKNLSITDFFESYIRTYIERDLKQIIDVKNLADFRRFLKVSASRVGQLLNFKSLSNDVGVSDVTIRKWIHALQLGGIIYLINPYFANIGKRLTKSPKLYFADHGLLCYLLGVENTKEWMDHPNKGNLWENFVFMELVKSENLVPGDNLFFYRDQNGVEIDFVIEKKGELIFVEAKAGENTDIKKVNFNKVVPLFEKKYKIKKILALNMNEKGLLYRKDYIGCNPLFTRIPI